MAVTVAGMTTTTPPPVHVPPPPAYRLLLVPVSLTMLVVLVVFVTTLLRFDALLAAAHAADPSTPHGVLVAQLSGRVVFGCLLAVSWPLALRRLGRGSTRVYARCRGVSLVAGVVLLAVALAGSGPGWLHAAHGVLAASEFGIFATALHPRLRAWYATNRRARR